MYKKKQTKPVRKKRTQRIQMAAQPAMLSAYFSLSHVLSLLYTGSAEYHDFAAAAVIGLRL